MLGLGKKRLTYKCGCCGKIYTGSPSLAYTRPPYWYDLSEAERDARAVCDDDLCHIAAADDGSSEDIFAIRCTLDVPICGVDEPFCWGVWVTQSADSFRKYAESFGRDQSGITTFGWLPVVMPYYNRAAAGDGIEHLPCDVQWCRKGQRPKIVLHESDHPLYRDQRDGIDWDTAVEIAVFDHTRKQNPPAVG